MKHWEFLVVDKHLHAEWNESATFNMQCRTHDGQWSDYHCFTVYGIKSEQEALDCILERIKEELKASEDLWAYLEENPDEMEGAVISV